MQATGKLLLGLVLILGLCSTGLEASSARDKPDPNQRTYDSNVHLSNEGDFHHRLTRFFSLGRMISDFLDGHCSIPFCSHILKEIVAEVEPNIFGIYSLNTVNSSLHEMDLLIHLLSFPGSNSTVNSIIKSLFNIEVLPATAVSYFSASAHFNHDFSDSEIDFESQAFLLLQSYSQVIEFQDANNNKLYDAGEELQVIDLGIAGWTTSQASTVDAGSGVTVYHITSTTSDKVFGFACDTSTYPVQDNLGQVISPNATKCSLSIDSFPFKGTNSLLALTMNVVLEGGQFSASASGIISGNTLTVQNTAANVIGGEFTWVSSVSSSGTDFPVAASVAAGSSTGVVDVLSQFAVKDSSLTVKDSKTVTFTFQTSANPTQVTWDPSVVYGQSPVVDSSSSVLRASLLSLLAAIFAFYWAF